MLTNQPCYDTYMYIYMYMYMYMYRYDVDAGRGTYQFNCVIEVFEQPVVLQLGLAAALEEELKKSV